MSEQQPQPERPADVGRGRVAKVDHEEAKHDLVSWQRVADDLGVHPWDVEAVMRLAGKSLIGRTELAVLLEEHRGRRVGPDAEVA